ncbi:lysylphosphatidylglycerol synthase transmembrane domain-containing protein [candidate division CSSED10-310 bacterium]|uniref:Lysylphosphatidylglycerol synthase transmembrane domain-containing protein n=1 Tax=candidate division CSSED10-310 bacterium TaxID=2855610 RepID=A0ABV6YV61_UNCC1
MVKLAVSSVLIWYVFSQKVSLNDVFQAFRKTSPFYLALAFLLHFVGLWISVSRWQLLLKSQDIRLSKYALTLLYLEGFFFNTFLPGSVGGDIVRAYKVSTEKLKSMAVILIERGSGILCLFIFVSTVTVFYSHRIPDTIPLKAYLAPLAILLTLFILTTFYFLIFMGRSGSNQDQKSGFFMAKLSKFHAALRIYKSNKMVLLQVFGLSFLLQLNVVIHYYFIMKSLYINIPLSFTFFAIPVIHFILMLPISINGIGVRENVFDYMLAPLFTTSAIAVTVSWIAFAMVLVFALMGGFIHVFRKKREPTSD